MKKAIIIIAALLVLCILCCVVMFFAARSLPALMDMLPQQVQDIVQTGTDQNSVDEEDKDTNDGIVNYEEDQETYNFNDGTTSWELNTGEKTWPSDMPSDVPQFEYGTIDTVNRLSTTEGKTWTIVYNNIESGSYAGFKSEIEAAGFVDMFTFETDDGWSIGGTKGDISILSGYDETEDIMNLIVTQKTGE